MLTTYLVLRKGILPLTIGNKDIRAIIDKIKPTHNGEDNPNPASIANPPIAGPNVFPKLIIELWTLATNVPVPPTLVTRMTKAGFIDNPTKPTVIIEITAIIGSSVKSPNTTKVTVKTLSPTTKTEIV